MLLRRYGTTVQSVAPEFKAQALNEIGFRRDRAFSEDAETFEREWTLEATEEIAGETSGAVQKDAEEALLEHLLEQLQGILNGLGTDHAALIENAAGEDWPKTRERRKDVIVEGKNRFHFQWRVDPPLRIGIYRRRE